MDTLLAIIAGAIGFAFLIVIVGFLLGSIAAFFVGMWEIARSLVEHHSPAGRRRRTT